MKDGEIEPSDAGLPVVVVRKIDLGLKLTKEQLRDWLNRKPLPKPAPKPETRTEVIYDAQSIAAHHDTHRHGHRPDCPKCHGSGRYVVECPTPGWRMADCECAK